MAQAKDILLRQKMVAEHKQGESYSSLSQRYGVSYNTVRSVCIRFEDSGAVGLIPRYQNCGRQAVAGSKRSFRLVRLLHHLHPTWGIGCLLERISMKFPDLMLQSERHYQRLLAQGSTRIPKAQLPSPAPAERSRLAHDTWQIDAKERIVMEDGTERCFLNITDEKTAGLLKAKAFPPGSDLPGVAL